MNLALQQLKTLCLHYHNPHNHQTWQVSDLWWEAPPTKSHHPLITWFCRSFDKNHYISNTPMPISTFTRFATTKLGRVSNSGWRFRTQMPQLSLTCFLLQWANSIHNFKKNKKTSGTDPEMNSLQTCLPTMTESHPDRNSCRLERCTMTSGKEKRDHQWKWDKELLLLIIYHKNKNNTTNCSQFPGLDQGCISLTQTTQHDCMFMLVCTIPGALNQWHPIFIWGNPSRN